MLMKKAVEYFPSIKGHNLAALGLFITLLAGNVFGQNLYISKFVPGDPFNQQFINHRVEIFNQSKNYIELTGYILVTRHYIVRLPSNTFIGPMRALKLGRVTTDANRGLDKEYSKMVDFLVREPLEKEEGDFAVLFSPNMEIIDAFYYGPNSDVSFLPASDKFTTFMQKEIKINLPDESDEKWGYLRNVNDPAMAFIRVNKKWKLTSRRSNLYPTAKYRFTKAQHVAGIVTLKWTSLFERDCFFHILERSNDGKNFQVIERLKGPVNSDDPTDFIYLDADVAENRVYYYRVENVDKFGNIIISPTIKVRTLEENQDGFTFDVLPVDKDGLRSLSVRFSAKESQNVKVKLLDELLREIDILYTGKIEANKQNLLNYTHQLPVGKYFVIVSTDTQRYYEPLVVD